MVPDRHELRPAIREDRQNRNGDSSSNKIYSSSNMVRGALRLQAARHRHRERAHTTAPPGVCDLSLFGLLFLRLDFAQGR
ncbi:unnamed protein product [Ectocarpus sp. 12 AP-2014]